jgi:hypothetical protein
MVIGNVIMATTILVILAPLTPVLVWFILCYMRGR